MAAIDPATLIVDNKLVTRVTPTIRQLAPLPILRAVVMRPGRVFIGGTTRMPNEEAYLAQERGEVPVRGCEHCRKKKPSGPFNTCVFVEGELKWSCANCHYGGNGVRCSFRDDYDNAVAALEADETPAPEIEGMAEPNYFGGSLKDKGQTAGTFAGTAPPIEGLARGGGKTKRIAPTPVDRHGQPLVGPFGTTLESGVKHARTLTSEERKAAMVKLKRELAALKIVEDEVEEAGSEDSEDGGDDETDSSDQASDSASSSRVSKGSVNDKKRISRA